MLLHYIMSETSLVQSICNMPSNHAMQHKLQNYHAAMAGNKLLSKYEEVRHYNITMHAPEVK